VERLGGLLDAQPAEETHFHHLTLSQIEYRQRIQGVFREALTEQRVAPPSGAPQGHDIFRFSDRAAFEGLLVDFAASRGATMIVRGMRAVSDYELEWEMALMNRRLRPEIETVFLMAGEEYAFISSHLVKEVAALGGNVSDVVPPLVEQRLKKRIAVRHG